MSEKHKNNLNRLWSDPVYHKKMSDAHKGNKHTEEQKCRISNACRKHYQEHPERIKKLSELHKGNKHCLNHKLSNEHKQSISEGLRKHERTEEHSKHLSESLKGRCFSKEHCMKIGETLKLKGIKPPSRLGIRPWNYMGKTELEKKTRLYRNIRTSYEYRQWRSDVFTRDNFTCQKCGKRGGKLHAHHKKQLVKLIEEYNIKTFQEALNCAELWNINNGETLCGEICHKEVEALLKGK